MGGGFNTSRTAGKERPTKRGKREMENVEMWKHGESAKEKWGGEESLKKKEGETGRKTCVEAINQ
jgi:hypothetical protein